MKNLLVIAVVLLVATVSAITLFPEKFNDHKIVTFKNPTKETRAFIEQLDLDIWTQSPDFGISVRFPAEEFSDFEKMCKISDCDSKFGKWEVEIDNLNELIDTERERISLFQAKQKQSSLPSFQIQQSALFEDEHKWFSEYHPLEDIQEWSRIMSEKYSDLLKYIPSLEIKTHEGRDIFALKLTAPNEGDKKQIYIQCMQHAREWIASATCQYLIHRLVKEYNSDNSRIINLLQTYEISFIPVSNPDGYAYSWSGNRLWRKNRRTNENLDNPFLPRYTYGVDLNRNWNDHWGLTGSSRNPSSEVYHGPSAASEPEVQALSKFFLSHKKLAGALDMHCFSQLILRPYGYTKVEPTESKEKEKEHLHKRLGDTMAKAIKATHGRSYSNIRAVDLYPSSGGASDWFFGDEVNQIFSGNKPYSYTLELRPASMREGGFILHPKNIVPTGEEIYEAFLVFTEWIAANPLPK